MSSLEAGFAGAPALGKNEVLARLSVGGMSEIFLALADDPPQGRRLLALKRILPNLRNQEEFVEMFFDEARISLSLAHPNIARVYELGQDGEELFLCMEFVPGQSIAAISRAFKRARRPIPIGFAALLARDLCAALAYAHEFKLPTGEPLPIVHRDITPNNVMMTYQGDVKVIDFGVAKAKGNLSRTSEGVVKGSQGYMSPEQARGAPLDTRTDLFSAAVILHELLTGQPLFFRESALLTMRGILRDEIPTPVSLNPGVPQLLSDVTMRALARDPQARFDSALQMARAIEMAVPALMFDQASAAQVMEDLFRDELAQTRQLTLLVGRTADVRVLQEAAAKLQNPLGAAPSVPSVGVVTRPSARARTEQDGPTVEGAVVLNVDDSEISRKFVEVHLEPAGIPVLGCGSAGEALQLMEQRLPDLILLDIHMPGIDGYALCRHIRQKFARRPFLPVLFLSSASTFEERAEGIAAGANDFIHKPYDPAELVGLVRAHLQRAAFLQQVTASLRKRPQPS